MRKLLYGVYLLFVAFIWGCTQDSIEESIYRDDAPKIYAYTDADDGSRVELNSNTKTVWTAGDQILVMGDSQFEAWQFTGKTGDRYGEFTRVTTYKNWGDVFGGKHYATYPIFNYIQIGYLNNEFVFTAEVKNEQEYHKDSFDPASNLMLGTSENGRDFYFNNLNGYLRLSLTGEGTVKSIKLQGNNGEIVAGTRYYGFNNISFTDWYEKTSKQITLNCPEGVKLSDKPTQFYFSLAPMTFENGINIDVEFEDGETIPKSTSKSITINRNTIVPMQNVKLNTNIDWQYALITYKDTESITAPQLYSNGSGVTGYIYWGDDTYSVANSTSSYVYTDGEDTHTVTVKVTDASAIEFSDCSNITSVDFSNF